MEPLRILIAESGGFAPQALQRLQSVGEVRLADLGEDELRAQVPPFHILWVRLKNRIGRQIIDAAPSLKAVATPTTGLNHLDLELLTARGIRVFSLRGETDFLSNIRATAEHTLGLMLALMRHVPAACRSVCEGAWDRDLFRGSELFEKTVGLVGYGRLGKLVARYCQSLGCKILATDPNVHEADSFVELTTFQDLLSRSDIVSLHVNLTEQTTAFFGLEEFQHMKPGSLFVNTARGELIDEVALLRNLESGKLAGAALDVLKDEQAGGFASRPLIEFAKQHTNLLITPHIGGCTGESMAKTEVFLAEKLAAAFPKIDPTRILASARTETGR